MGSDAATPGRDGVPGDHRVRTHRVVFLPSLVVALLYGGLWLWYSGGTATDGVARAALLVLAVGVPLLIAHAAIRYYGAEIVVRGDEIIARPGLPKRSEIKVLIGDVREVAIRRGLIGRVFDVGTVVLTDRSGRSVTVPDLAGPQRVVEIVKAGAVPNVSSS
ncbi:MAG: PH domain-containing protein [Hyphomicrobiales bacterium]